MRPRTGVRFLKCPGPKRLGTLGEFSFFPMGGVSNYRHRSASSSWSTGRRPSKASGAGRAARITSGSCCVGLTVWPPPAGRPRRLQGFPKRRDVGAPRGAGPQSGRLETLSAKANRVDPHCRKGNFFELFFLIGENFSHARVAAVCRIGKQKLFRGGGGARNIPCAPEHAHAHTPKRTRSFTQKNLAQNEPFSLVFSAVRTSALTACGRTTRASPVRPHAHGACLMLS